MTTRRERMERRAQLRAEWAIKAEARAAAANQRARAAVDGIEPGQPILVGHHSERKHRGALERHDRAMRRWDGESKLAAHHEAKAANLEHALARTIFSDDEDATERLADKAAAIGSWADRMVAINKAWRGIKKPKLNNAEAFRALAVAASLTDDEQRKVVDAMRWRYEANPQPFPAYSISNARANERRCAERIKEVELANERTAAAESSGGVLVTGEEYVSVTFSEKPDRQTIDALKAAFFRWGNGSWHGRRDRLPGGIVRQIAKGGAL